jgi:ATP-dependent RNA helicase DHX57
LAPERSLEIGAKKNGGRVENQTDGALDAASLVSAPVRESQSKVQRERRDRGHRTRLPSKAFLEKENVRLKLAQEAYFGSTRIGGKSASADGARASAMVASRANLPASGSREEVTSAVASAPVVVLSGETGCGKSTQVPQFILERAIVENRGAETNIVCTQPRRISAIGLAERVAAERVERCGDVVGYSVRLESKLSEKTRLHFCTMGILLRRLLSDPSLSGVTHVVLDEVHERSVESDLLLLLLRRLLNRRRDLRVVLMSATADADFFAAYFEKPDAASVAAGVTPTAAIKVFIKGFTHPVREYFLEDVLEMTGFAVGKGSKWAKKKAKGAPGEPPPADRPDPPDAVDKNVADGSEDTSAIPEDWEDDDDVRAPSTASVKRDTSGIAANEDWTISTDSGFNGSERKRVKESVKERERVRQDELAEASRRLSEYSDATQRSIANVDESLLNYELIEMLIGAIARAERENGAGALVARFADGAVFDENDKNAKDLGAVLVFLPGQMEITRLIRDCERSRHLREEDVGRLQFLPLYGALSSNDQRRIFARAPPGVRKVVVATNIAETSVTIDDVRYVIDTGRAKEMGYDSARGLSVLADAWISRAASMQRRGRAGRTAPGACFALFSRRGRANLTPHQPPEMLRTPLQQLCLNIKALTPSGDGGGSIMQTLASAPTPPAAEAVQTALRELRALRALDAAETLTPLGRHVAHMPVDARIGKMLLFGALLGCLDPILTIAASMAGRPVFVSPKDAKAEADAAKRRLASPGKSDHLTVASAYAQWQKCGGASARRAFCEKNFLSQQALEGVHASRQDYAAVLADLGFVSREYLAKLKREGVGGGVADRNAGVGRVVKAALVAGFYPQVVSVRHPETKFVQTAGGTVERESRDGRELKFFCEDVGRVFLHPSSVNASAGKFESPWLVFGERVETARVYVRDCTMVGAYALLLFGGDVEVDHEKGRVTMDGGWAQFSAPARIGVLIREMRAAVDKLLERHIDAPVAEGEDDLSSSPVVKAVLELLATEGL